MGGRGTFASGKKTAYTYKTVGKIGGIKVLQGLGGKHGLPEEAHSSGAYIKLKPDGTFHEMRIYDKDHYLVKEIAYHPERKIDRSGKPVLHVHEYKRDNFQDRPAKPISKSDYNKYKKFFKGGA